MKRSIFGALVAVAVLVTIAVTVLIRVPAAEAIVEAAAIEAPDTIDAGEIVSINVAGDRDGLTEVLVRGAYAELRFELPIRNGEGRLDLPAAVTQHAGVVTIEAGGQRHDMEIQPGVVDALVAPLVGPRTIVANGADETLAVLLPTDRFGNQVADGTSTEITWNQPGDVEGAHSQGTLDGMAWVFVPSGEVAGATTVRASAHSESNISVNGAAVRIDEVPGTVADVMVTADEVDGVADGRSVITLNSGPLTDTFGNTLADGTSAQFRFDGPSGQGVVVGTVQNGRVRIDLNAPSRPGRLTGYLDIHGVASNELAIDYSTAISGFDAYLDVIGDDAVLRVENALDPSAAFVADGTEIIWGELRGILRHGSAELWVPASLVDTELTVEILGLNQTPEQEER